MEEYNPAKEAFGKFQCTVRHWEQRQEANKHYEHFENAVKSRNNSVINETVVVKALDLIIANKNSALKHTLQAESLIYRARKIDFENNINLHETCLDITNKFEGFNFDNSLEPPISIPQSGRANIEGQSYLYVATDPYTACCECKSPIHSIISVATLKILRDFDLIDLCAEKSVKEFELFKENYGVDPSVLITNIMLSFCDPIIDKNGYTTSQFISDYFRKTGIDGIKYNSLLGTGHNIVIFNSYKKYFDLENSEIVYLMCSNPQYLRLQNNSILKNDRFDLTDEKKKDITHQIQSNIVQYYHEH